MMNSTVIHAPKVAVIGSGYWGKNLIRNFHQLGILKLICDKNETLLDQFKNQYPEVETCLAFSEILSHNDVDGFVIATPAETHYILAREALLAHKHVFVEKPLVLFEEEAEELIALAQEKHCVLMVGHLLQYHPIFKRLKELAIKGELGRINYIYSHRLNLGKIRREENILWSFAPHDISMILSLAGEEPESVVATGGNYLHERIPDVTTTHLEFASGLRAHIFVSWPHPFKEQKLVVVGDHKMAVFDDTKRWEEKLLLYPHKIDWKNYTPVPTKAEPEKISIPEDEPLCLECKHFLECLASGKQPMTDGQEGLRVLRILNASQRSLDDHCRKVSLKPVAGDTFQKDSSLNYFVHKTAMIDNHVTIGKGCKIQNNVSVYKGVTLEDGVFCGPSMVFTNIINPRAEIYKMDQLRHTLVKQGATIGANATIVCGVTLGRYCFVGAGAVVTKDAPDYALVVGNPARQIGWMCACGVNA
jgi:UDP-2-acetamido-3-amino-2,3-dideoxy-glucuronate N-acetyltransferase